MHWSEHAVYNMAVRLSDFQYVLPKKAIAKYPLAERDRSRLLVLGKKVVHKKFSDLPKLLPKGSLLILNDTRVLPARVFGHREPGGGRVELLCVRPLGDDWLCLGQASKPLRPGTEIFFQSARATILERRSDELLEVRFDGANAPALLAQQGHVPLPPYLERDDEPLDRERYQTVFASSPGAVAAPTAGLHFTSDLLAKLTKGCEVRRLTLHVGPGTFLPPREEAREKWRLPAEPYFIPRDTADAIEQAARTRRPVVAVGTSTTRALETYARTGRREGETSLTLAPGDPFQLISGLLTNFHMPKTTLLALVCGFGGQKRVLTAYRQAVRAGYRLLSYGDAMLVWPP